MKYIKLFDYSIMPSRSEGFCLALVEAVQQKVPVLCSDIEIFREIFSDGEVSYFDLDNKVSLINAYKRMQIVGTGFIENAFARFNLNYTDSKMSELYYQVYSWAG